MKSLIFTVLFFLSYLSVLGQNGIKNGKLFILKQDQKTISINSFEDNGIKQIKTFTISEKSIYTTDQKERVVILDTVKNNISLINTKTESKSELKIPFDLKPKTILLNDENLFIGGEMGKEMLVQYNIQSQKWYKLEIPIEVLFPGKAIDDLVINDSLLIAIDNIVMPKYVLFYKLSSNEKLILSHFKELKSNGAYESIYQGRITDNYIGLISGTYSGYVGATEHITVYDNLNLKNSFALSSNAQKKDYHTFMDFVIIGDKIAIASKEKGFGLFQIKNSYFKESDEYRNSGFNSTVNTSKIKYAEIKNETIIKITIVPNTNKIVLTIENTKGKIRHEIREI
ncbi:hypothetical protein [Maribacter arcticus]|uniref:Uncharacterized protein n=1 Tax=Maribacter arcticus TaxID=561365 RepID=A0A1T5E0G9_9FLAO|nr:hypothetical protein [Maribacter arcticus]SKB77414.1 hypothetical protein SAMN05660866_03197 [Maribacter arcticus]